MEEVLYKYIFMATNSFGSRTFDPTLSSKMALPSSGFGSRTSDHTL
jgi:hypothetical protein